MNPDLEQILNQQPNIWRASGNQHAHKQTTLDTGHKALNSLLHGGGWPLACNNEIYIPHEGIGELRLLLPGLRQIDNDGYIFWIAPPFLPFAPALAQQQVDLKKLVIVNADNPKDALWAAEQAMLSGCCSAVFSWLGTARLGMRELRRLQLAAQKNACWHVLFRHSSCTTHVSSSAFRMKLETEQSGQLAIEILKQPGGWSGQKGRVSIAPHYEQWQRLPADLLPSYNEQDLPVIGDSMPVETSISHLEHQV